MTKRFSSERKFREWQSAVAMQYGIEPAPLSVDVKKDHDKAEKFARDRRSRRQDRRTVLA